MTADVSREEDIKRIIEDTENHTGPIDLFCSNAGVGMGANEQSPDKEWQMSWDINVMSHVYAARHLVPRMIERGEGYFLNTASAAGLLNQIGGAAYGVSKHAAVGFEHNAALESHCTCCSSIGCNDEIATRFCYKDKSSVIRTSSSIAEGNRTFCCLNVTSKTGFYTPN